MADNSRNKLEIELLKDNYIDKLGIDAQYSLEVDPTNTYRFSETTKKFIKLMVDYNDVSKASKILKISLEDTQDIYFTYGVRAEILRIRSAIYHRQFAGRMLNLDEIGGYLSAVLMDSTMESEKADVDQKIKISKLLIDLNDKKNKIIDDPSAIDVIPTDIESQIGDLSVNAIKSLLDANKSKKDAKSSNKGNDKNNLIDQTKEKDKLSDDEVDSLKKLSTKELLEILKEGA